MKDSNYDIDSRLGRGDEDEDSFNDLDIAKLLAVLRSSVLYILIIFAVTCSSAYLFIRYTKPVFESKSQLKLNTRNEAVMIGLPNPLDNTGMNSLSGEIELLKSNLFFARVVEAINYDVSYHYYGNILTEERYKNAPFVVSHKLFNSGLFDRPIVIDILSESAFNLSYESGGEVLTSSHKFGERIATNDFNLLLEKTDNFSSDNGIGKYYFTINSESALINYFQSNVTVQPLNFSAKTIQISLKDFNKYKARDFVIAIDTLYLKYTKEDKNQAIEQKLSFLNKQLQTTEEKIEEYEDYFESFTIENRTTNIQNDLGKTIVLLQSLDSQRYDLQNKLTNIQMAQAQLEKEQPLLISSYSSSTLPTFVSTALAEYNKLFNERQLLLGSYNENTFAVSRMTQQLTTLRENVAGIIDEYHKNLIKGLKELDLRRANLEKNFVELPSMGTEFNKTRRFYTLQEEFYFSLIKSKAELEIAKAGTVDDFDILSPASLPGDPVHPQKLIIYGIGVVSGLIIGFLFVGVRYLLHNKISNQRELERLVNVPVVGSVPLYRKEKMPTTRMLVHKMPKSVLSESFRSIRTNIDFLQNGADKRVIAVTSTISGEGKTFVVVNLGAILATTGKKILVVDLDMRKPKIHLAFGEEKEEKGMSTILIGRDSFADCLRDTDVEGLYYLAAGPIPPNPSELLLGEGFDKFIEQATQKFDLVILDTPPVGLVTDGVIIMKKADLNLYVVRADYSRKIFLKTLQKLIRMNKFRNLSLILNSVKISRQKGYGYGTGYGYGYGQGYYDEGEKRNGKS